MALGHHAADRAKEATQSHLLDFALVQRDTVWTGSGTKAGWEAEMPRREAPATNFPWRNK
jgi:hypothetical protein